MKIEYPRHSWSIILIMASAEFAAMPFTVGFKSTSRLIGENQLVEYFGFKFETDESGFNYETALRGFGLIKRRLFETCKLKVTEDPNNVPKGHAFLALERHDITISERVINVPRSRKTEAKMYAVWEKKDNKVIVWGIGPSEEAATKDAVKAVRLWGGHERHYKALLHLHEVQKPFRMNECDSAVHRYIEKEGGENVPALLRDGQLVISNGLSVDAGRVICVEGKPFVGIAKKDGTDPIEADAFTHFIAETVKWDEFQEFLKKYKKR